MSVEREAKRQSNELRRAALRRSRFARRTKWLISLAAILLAFLAAGSYAFHRARMGVLASEHLRLMVLGPSAIRSGVPATFEIHATTVTGAPMPAQIEADLFSPDGKRLLGRKEATDEKGYLQITIPGDMSLPASTTLSIAASARGSREETAFPLSVEPMRYSACVTLNKMRFRPGETLFFRALALRQFDMSAEREFPIRCEILNARGEAIAGLRDVGVTSHAVGSGRFVLPTSLPSGLYFVAVSGLDRSFPETRQAFLVQDGTPLPIITSSSTENKPENAASPVRFYPEGGDLVAGLPNRVYFSISSASATTSEFKGTVYDNRGVAVCVAQFDAEGLGSFDLVPQQGATYRLKIAKPDGAKEEAELPTARTDRHLVFSTGASVFSADSPLEFVVRASQANIPVVVAAYCRGVLVGQQYLVTQKEKNGLNSVVMPLPDDVAGVIRLTVFEYAVDSRATAANPTSAAVAQPHPVAERLVFRKSNRKLTVQAKKGTTAEKSESQTVERPDKVRLDLTVTDEGGAEAPAVLGLSVLEKTMAAQPIGKSEALARFFFMGEVLGGASTLEEIAVPLFGSQKDDGASVAALDKLLAIRGWRRFTDDNPSAKGSKQAIDDLLAKDSSAKGSVIALGGYQSDACDLPPALFDNLARIQSDYEKSLSAYRAEQARLMSALTTISFLAGLGMLLFLFMASVLRLITGLALTVPLIGSAVCCFFVGVILFSPEMQTQKQSPTVPFLSYHCYPPGVKIGEKINLPINQYLLYGLMPRSPLATVGAAVGFPSIATEGGATVNWGRPTLLTAVSPAKETVELTQTSPNGLQTELDSLRKRNETVLGVGSGAATFWRIDSDKRSSDGKPSADEKGKAESDPLDADRAKIDSYRFPTRVYAYRRGEALTDERIISYGELYWNPLIVTDGRGRATVEFAVPSSVEAFSAQIDAHGGDRIGSTRVELDANAPAK